mgnify:CR=1 FL=1
MEFAEIERENRRRTAFWLKNVPERMEKGGEKSTFL